MLRLPAFTLLTILAPVVRLFLGALSLLGVLVALFWRLVGPPHFPFLPMLAGAIALAKAPEQSLYAIAAGVLLLIFVGIRNAWDVVTFLAIEGRNLPPS